jgi:hypothetical protein
MKRSFTIIEGEGKGRSRTLDQPLMIIGRSRNADFQIDDPLISRRHLEVRVEPDAVFVEDKSTHGSLLNGQRLSGIVSLNPGDVIEIGRVKLRYEEREETSMPAASPADETNQPESSEVDGTLAAPARRPGAVARARPGRGDCQDHTRALELDHTRMADPSELPDWKALEREYKKTRPIRILWLILGLLMLVGATVAGWFLLSRHRLSVRPSGTIEFKDAMLGYSIEYPLDWTKITDTSGEVTFGVGNGEGTDWARVRVHADRQPRHALTGLTDGFAQYQEVLRKQFKEFELKGSKLVQVNDVTTIFFGFRTPNLDGKGIYVLNAEIRIVITCFSPRVVYDRYASVYSDVLKSFRLRTGEPQEFIDFPLPDETMKQLALANPVELARHVDEHIRRGDALLAERDVKAENLYRAVQEYQQALQLAIAPPQRLEQYQQAALGLNEATRLFNQAVERQRFEINRALRERDREAAYWAANRMLHMVPDKTHPAYQEAYKIVRSLQKQ